MQKEMRGINLHNLMWKIIFAWKQILIIGMVCSLILVGIKYNSDYKNSKASEMEELELSESEKVNANKLLELYDQLNYYETYIKESLVMQVNPLSYEVVKLQYYVDSSYMYDFTEGMENDYTGAVVTAYASYITSDNFLNSFKELMKIEKTNNYIRELFTVSSNATSSILDITVIVPVDADANEIIKNIETLLINKSDTLQNVGEHELVEVNASIDKISSLTMFTQRNTTMKSLDSIKQLIETEKASLALKELIYVDENLQYEQYKSGAVETTYVKPSINVKYAIVGFVLGGFCVVVYYCIIALFSNKLQDANDIRILYNVGLLGCVKLSTEKEGPIRNVLMNVKCRNKKQGTHTQQISKIATGISIHAEKHNISKIYLSSSISEILKDSEIIKDIQDALKDKNIEINGIGTLSSEANAMENANIADAVIIIEMFEKSRYSQIEQEILTVTDYDMQLIGAIVVE